MKEMTEEEASLQRVRENVKAYVMAKLLAGRPVCETLLRYVDNLNK